RLLLSIWILLMIHYHNLLYLRFLLSKSQAAHFEVSCLLQAGLVYCMDYMVKISTGWKQNHYLPFDFPGQVEHFFLHSNAKSVIMKLIKKLNLT
ncbi:hypothetical protein S83_055463, partial [Arachis hypogaea]